MQPIKNQKMKSEMTFWNKTLLFFFITCMGVSCKKECDEKGPQVFYDTVNQNFSYKCTNDNDKVVFNLEDFSDLTYAYDGSYPDKDIFRIYVDFNRNGIVDEGIDLMFSPINSNVCIVKLISQTSTTACTYNNSDASYLYWSGSSTSGQKQHISFIVSIRKSLLSNGTKANIVVELYDAETGWKHFPSKGALFTDVFEISL